MAPIDLENLAEGYKTHLGPPPTYTHPGLRLWTEDAVANQRAALYRKPNGRWGLRTITRMRALSLLAQTGTVPGFPFDSGFSDELFPFSSPDQIAVWTFPFNMPESGSDVSITVETIADMTFARHMELFANGILLKDDIFLSSGQAEFSSETFTLSADPPSNPNWNTVRDQGVVLFSFGVVAHGPTEWVRFKVFYTTTDQVVIPLANGEVCYPHELFGVARKANGRWSAMALLQPDDDNHPPKQAQTFLYRVRPGDHAGLGTPGRWVHAFAGFTPTTSVGIYNTYPNVCGVGV